MTPTPPPPPGESQNTHKGREDLYKLSDSLSQDAYGLYLGDSVAPHNSGQCFRGSREAGAAAVVSCNDLVIVRTASQLLHWQERGQTVLEVILRNLRPPFLKSASGRCAKSGQRGRDLGPVPNPLA